MTRATRRGFLQAVPLLGAASLQAMPAAAKKGNGSGKAASGLRAAAFSCEVTPPVGSPLEECRPPVATSVDAPLLAKGVVLADDRTRYVLCSFDYCELRTAARDVFRRKIADVVQVPERQVAVHCVHQHDAPMYDVNAEVLADLMPSPPHVADLDFIASASDRVAAAARDAIGRLEPLTHVGRGKGWVQKFASNRRILRPDGSIGVRYSSCTDPELIAAPEGLIDPWLRTITLYSGQKPLARLHYYASHPQSHYGKGHMNPDTPGLARERLEKEEGIPQIYFTGCGGNVAAGKYNDGSPAARVQLAERLYQGMKGAIVATQREKCTGIAWKTADVRFSPRSEPDFSEPHFRQVLADPGRAYQERTKAAFALAWYGRMKLCPAVDVSCCRLGSVRILHLPGEAFVEYQLFAQSLRPADFVATAAYGELGMGYICTDKAFGEGGYEPTQAFGGPATQARLEAAIREALT